MLHYGNDILYKHKKTIDKIDGCSRDGSTKKYTNKGSRDNKVHVTSLLLFK